MAHGAMVRHQARAQELSRKLSDYRGGESMRTGVNAGVVLAGAFAGGVLDAKAPEIAGVRPSLAAGIVAATAGIMSRSPKVIMGAAGLLASAAYEAGLNMGGGEPDTTDDGDTSTDDQG